MTMAGRGAGRPGRVALILMMMTMMSRGILGDINCAAETTQYKTTVFCFFGQNINESEHNFNIYFYPPSSPNDPKVVLICNWQTKESLICSKDEKYAFDEKVSDRLTLTGPASHDLVGGEYVCQTVPQLQSSKVHICPLEYREVPTTKPPPTASQPPVTGYPAGWHGQGDKTQHTSDGVIVALLVLNLLVIFIIVIAIILYWKRQRIRQWWRAKRTGASDSMNVENEAESLMEENDPQEDQSSPGMTVEAYYYYKGWAHACNYGLVDKTKMPKEWVEECDRFFADKTQIPQDKSWLDPMNPHTEKQMPVKDSVKKGVYEAPGVRETRLDMTKDQWLEQKKQEEKMAKAEKDRKTREAKTWRRKAKETTLDDSNSRPDSTSGAPPSDAVPGVTRPGAQCTVQPVTFNTASPQGQGQMSDSLGEDANTTDPQDVGACVPLMEGEQEPDGERTTALLTVDEATRKVKEAETKVQETKKVKNETKKAANKDANKHCEEVQTQAKNAGERYEKAKEVLEEAKSALETAKKAKKNKDKK